MIDWVRLCSKCLKPLLWRDGSCVQCKIRNAPLPKPAGYLEADQPDHPMIHSLGSPFSQIRRLIAKYGLKCHWCGRFCNPAAGINSDARPTREHLIRRADGGSSKMNNLRIACRKCNNSRHSANWNNPNKKFYEQTNQKS